MTEKRWFADQDNLRLLSKEELKDFLGEHAPITLEEAWEVGCIEQECLNCGDCDLEGVKRIVN